jgi:hypothetical protein
MASQVPEEMLSGTPEDEEAMEVLRERESPIERPKMVKTSSIFSSDLQGR